jgi:hypothetical protein
MKTGMASATACALMAIVWHLGTSAAYASEFTSGQEAVISRERVINDDLMISGNAVNMQGTVNGDVYAAGARVTVSGPVQDDVVTVGANVTLSGTVGDDLRAAGAEVIASAPIQGNALLTGSRVTLRPTATVGRDLNVSGGDVLVEAKVGRNLVVTAGNARLGSEVGGQVQARVGRLTVLPGAVIRGDLLVYSPNPPTISSQAQVLGRVVHHKTPIGNQGGGFLGWLSNWLISFLMVTALGATIIAVSPVWPERVAQTMSQRTGLSALTGLLGVILAPIVGILLLISVLGVPLGLLTLLLYGIGLLLSSAFVAYLSGRWLVERLKGGAQSPYVKLVWGALLLTLLVSLPGIGGFILCLALILGFGAIAVERRDYRNRLRAEGLA